MPTCNKFGYCDLFDDFAPKDGTNRCERLNDEERQELLSLLRPQPDGSFEFVDNDEVEDGKGSKRTSSDETQVKKVPRTFGKRSLPSEHNAALPQDASKPVYSGSVPNDAGSQEVGGSGLNDVKADSGDWKEKYERFLAEVEWTASIKVDHMGQCKRNPTTCMWGECKLGSSPDCHRFVGNDRNAKIDEVKQDIVYRITPDGMEQDGCRLLSPQESAGVVSYLYLDDDNEIGFELPDDKKTKSCSEVEQSSRPKVYGDGISQQQVIATAQRIANVAAEMDTQHYGVCPKDSSTCTTKFCKIQTPGCLKDKEEYRKLFSDALAKVFTLGFCKKGSANCNEHGQCHLFLANGERNHACPVLPPEWMQIVLRNEAQSLLGLDKQGSPTDYPPTSAHLIVSMYPPYSPATYSASTTTQHYVSSPDIVSGTVEFKGEKLTAQQLAQKAVQDVKNYSTLKVGGNCGDDSKTCKEPCQESTPGCSMLTQDNINLMTNISLSALTAVYLSGTCNPFAKESVTCNEQGRCKLWTIDGQRDHGCMPINDDYLYASVSSAFEKAFHPDEAYGTTVQHEVSAEPLQKRDVNNDVKFGLVKRALVNGPFRAKTRAAGVKARRDEPERPLGSFGAAADGKRHVSSSSEDDAGGAMLHGVELSKQHAFKLADHAASQAVALAFYDLGYCDEKSSICHGETCSLDTPGCIAYPDELIDEYEQKFAAVYRRVFVSGTCDASDSTSGNCDEYGQCQMWLKDGERDYNCKVLTSKQVQSRLRAELDDMFSPDSPDAGSEKRPLQKRNADHGLFRRVAVSDEDRNLANIHGVELSFKQALHLADQAAAQSIAETFEKHGYCDAKSSTCRDEVCELSQPGCIAYSDEFKHEYYVKFRAIFRSVLISGSCDPNDNDEEPSAQTRSRFR
ncbi:hypothetical protein [Sporisorium scitamineum]|uniref:Uncharacterized protein n=1 Tax=Sporisorium scitamineum TaxID=49012 RepID=A0A0F7RVW5_9BASI|nr:hypothetical protein [Sporisorium scitamineum]